MKNRIMELAKLALNFQIDVPYSPLYLLRFFDWVAPHYAFLYLISREYKPRITVEIGMSWGIGAVHLALGNSSGCVHSIDDNPEVLPIFDGFKFNVPNVFPYISNSVEAAQMFSEYEIDLLYIDGDHRYKYAKKDYEVFLPKMKEGGIILIDDIELNYGMRRFWREIKEPKFNVNFIRPVDRLRIGRGAGFGVVLV